MTKKPSLKDALLEVAGTALVLASVSCSDNSGTISKSDPVEPNHAVGNDIAQAEFDPKSRGYEGIVTVSSELNVAAISFEPIAIVS